MIEGKAKKLTVFSALVFFAIFSLLSTGPLRSGESLVPSAHAGFFNDDLEVFEEVMNLVADKYVYSPDFKKLFSSAIENMVDSVKLEGLSLVKSPSGQRVRLKTFSVNYTLNYDPSHNMESFKKVYYFLLNKSDGKYTKEDLDLAGISGLMSSLDTYSQFLDKSAFDKSMRDTEGKYGGLGMVITMKDKRLFVVKTMRNSPAERAGILPEDSFRKINGQSVEGLHIHELADKLRGYPDTKVSVTLFRPAENREQTYPLTREIISIESVSYKAMANHIGYIQINSFSKQTNDQLESALTQAKKDGVKAFVLDLRDNPGGLLNQSVKVASHFLFHDRLVVYTQGRTREDYREYHAQYKNSLLHMPVVVLINHQSASASEIVAGALRDSGKALIIGDNSYGKGSVQTIFRISDGSGLRLTTSKYYTPSGTDITKQGIIPEIKIVQDADFKGNGETPVVIPDQGILNGQIDPIQLKQSALKKFLREQGGKIEAANDPVLQFSLLVLRNVTTANKKQTLDKAREIAANIHY